jgi:ligand-binding sensor domain-containing protein/AraC-like DNA-binding protein
MFAKMLLCIGKSGRNFASLYLCVIALFFSVSVNLWSLDPLSPLDKYLVDIWGTDEGMPIDMVQALAQTPDGYLWIATSKGLVRFDGKKFAIVPFHRQLNASLVTDIPDALFVDKDGVLWIGSEHGVTTFDYRSGNFKTFTPDDGIIEDKVRLFFQDSSGKLWICSDSNYVNCFADGKFRVFDSSDGLAGKKINGIVELPEKDLLFASRYNGLFLYRADTFSPLSLPLLGNAQIITLGLDHPGDVWVGTNQGLLRVQNAAGKLTCTRFSKSDGLSDDMVTKILLDRHHRLWIGTLKGLNRLIPGPRGAVEFEYMFPTTGITSLVEGQSGEMWIGGYSQGLFRLKDPVFHFFSPQIEYPGEIFFSLFEDRRDNVWIGTASGKLHKYHDDKLLEIVDYPELNGTSITAIGQDHAGNIWVGTNGLGTFQLSPMGLWIPDTGGGLGDNVITSIYRDRKNNMWFGTREGAGVLRFSSSKIDYLGSIDGLASKKVHAIFEDSRQNIWILTNVGVTFLKEGNTSAVNVKHFFGDLSVACIREDKSNNGNAGNIYWVATRGSGLLRVKLKEGKPDYISFDVSRGMVTNTIYRFLEDDSGFFWMLSDSGILRVGKDELNRVAGNGAETIQCVSYGESDGIKSFDVAEFSRHMALKSADNTFWFITRNGIYRLKPDNIKSREHEARVIIESVLCDKKEIPVRRASIENVFNSKSGLEFNFTSPSLLSPEKVKFKFRLIGFDEQWQYLPPNSPRAAYYKNLEAGDYKFEVFACNAVGDWSTEPATFLFSVESHFYETLVFRIGTGLLIIGLLGLSIYFYWLSKRQPEEKRPPPYKTAQPLHPDFAEECLKKLDHQMKVEKIYTDPELSLKKLAESIKVTNHQLSRLLNDNLDSNFAEFINTHRIDEAKEILADPERSKEKITNIALDVGFNTMPAFYNAFKRYTNMTPSAYKKAMKKKKK